MKRITRSFLLSPFRLRMCFLLYVMLAIISTLNSTEIYKPNGSKMTYTKEKPALIKNLKKSIISSSSSHQRENNKVDVRNRIANKSAKINDKENSVALNKFLEDVLKARKDLNWIDHATCVNYIAQLDDLLAYTNWLSLDIHQHKKMSYNIDYRNRLRSKRGFDQNYERMWMAQKKKYGKENTHDIPQRIYLDNDMTFKREANDADFNILYRSPDTLIDRSIYEGEAIVDQPLKDWARKKDLHSSSDWSNFNENPKVTNDENIWLRDYKFARKILANPDLSKNEKKLHVNNNMENQLEIVSFYDPMRANNFRILQKSPSINKLQNTSLTLESLKKIVLDLRNNLTINNKKENVVLSREFIWWNYPKSAAKVFDFDKDLDEHPYKKTMWRIKRAKNINSKDESDPRISREVEFQKLYLGGQNLKELHNCAKRSKRSFSKNLNNQKNISKNYLEAQIIKDTLGNITRMQKTKENVAQLYSNYFNDKRSLPRTLNNTSFFLVNIDLQTYSPEHIDVNTVTKINLKKIDQYFPTEKIPKNINYTTENHSILLNFEKDFAVSNTSVDSILSSKNANDSWKFAENRKSNKEKLSARKKSRLDMNDGQSKNAREEFLEGNTSPGFDMAANESRRIHDVETIVAATKREEIETNGMLKENRELIPGVIKVFETREHPYQKQETETRLLERMREDEKFAEQTRTNDVDESTDANAREDSSSSIDLVIDATEVKLKTASVNASEIAESIISKDRRQDLATMIVDNDLRKQQQMVSSLSVTNNSANKSNGNSDTDKIDIRVVGSNGNETMNVKEGTRAITGTRKSDNHLRRRLLWISTDTETEDSLIKSTKLIPNSVIKNRIKNVDKNRQPKKIINSADSRKVLIRVKRDNNAEKNFTLQNNLNLQMSNANYHARYKRSTYSFENIESNNAAENVEVGKEVAVNHDEKEENNEEYENVEKVKEDYNDSEEDVMEELDNDRAMKNEREKQVSFRQQIDPVKAKVNMLIKQKLEKRNKDDDYKRKRRMLDMIEYYDYDDNNEEQEHDMPINKEEIHDKNDEVKDKRLELKRAAKGKTPCKPGKLGKKKNENAEAMMKQEREKAKNKEPKEQIVIDLGERKNKTSKNSQKDKKPSIASESSLRDSQKAFKEKQLSTEEDLKKIRQNEDLTNNIYQEEPTDLKSKWLDQSFENRMAFPKNSEIALNDNHRKKISLNKPLEITSNAHVAVNPDVIENILLDIQPIKILEQNKELEAWKDFYEDFENKRPEDRYYYQENDRRYPNNIEPLYEELKNVYDWSDGELKSRPRLRGDQRLRYESDNKLDTNPFQLQPLNDRFFSSNQTDNEQKKFQLANASRTIAGLNITATRKYLTFNVTDNMFKDGLEQSNSSKKNLPNILSVSTSTESVSFKIIQNENNSFPERSTIKQSEINIDSGSPYENRKYIESETRKLLKQNLNLEKQAAISSQDLHESFVESLDWHDDFDNNVKIRLGRGLKAVEDEVIISDSNKTQDNKSDLTDITNINSKFSNFSRIFCDNSAISHNWYNDITADLINVFNVASEQNVKKIQKPILTNKIYVVNDDKDLEAEQKNINNQTTRVKRAASYRTFYDDVSGNRDDSDDADKSLSNHFQLSNILENQSNDIYNNVQDFDQYSQIPRTDLRIKENSGKKNKKNKQPQKHAKKTNLHSSSRNRKHHTHRFDLSRNVNRDDLKPKKKNKFKASFLTGRTRIQKSEMTEQDPLYARVNEESPIEKVLYENVEDQNTVKPEEDNARRKEITLLLAADNIDDESQMDIALHGELAGKIVEQIFKQVQNNDQLKNVFGPKLQRNYKTKEIATASNIYQQGFEKNKTNRTETLMKRVKELIGRLILNEVQKKTCVSLSPDMREFLGWMLEIDREEEPLEEVSPLPLIYEEIIPKHDPRRKFLFFDNISEREDISNLQKKVKVLDTLVKEYNTLTAKEKTKVQTVHNYLIRQLNLLLRHIEEREKKEKLTSVSVGEARAGIGNILQYQSATPNITNANYSMTKDVFSNSLPINTHNFFRFNNISPKVADRQYHDGHTYRRGTRSLEIPSKEHRETKRQKFRNYKRNKNNSIAKRKHRKNRKHQSRAGSLSRYKKSRQKRASEGKNFLYLGYEKPTIYDSFDLLDAKLTENEKKKKRELVNKKNMTIENYRMLDLLPIKGKNRLEDEVILLNKREAWRKENEKQLEEVAFGKDMRNGTKKEKERFKKLIEEDKHKLINESSSRTKRENIIHGTSIIKNTTIKDRFDKSHSVSKVNNNKSEKILRTSYDNNDNGVIKIKDVDKLRLVEHRINVFADKKTDAAIDTTTTEVSTREKLVINAGTNNQVKEKLCAVNRGTKIDRTNESTSFVNLTSDTNIGVSKERQKVLAAEKEANDNAVKLNRATNYRSEEIDPEIELKNFRQKKRIYDIADSKIIDLFHNDNNNLFRNKLREKYIAKLNVPSDLDLENNLELPRLKNNKWSNDIVEWKLFPVIKNSPHYDDHALSHIRLTEKETPISNNIRNIEIEPNVYLNSNELKHRRNRNSVFNFLPVLGIIDDNDNFLHRIHSKTKLAKSKDLRVDSKIALGAQKLSRRKNNKRSNGVAKFEVPFVKMKNYNSKLREISRSRNDPELDDRLIYNGLPLIWSHRYYDDYENSPTFRFVPNILIRDDDAYRYPAGVYLLEYGPFKKRTRDSNRRVVSRKRFRLKTSGEEVVDFPADNLASNISKSSLTREKFLVQTDKPVLANRKDYFVFNKTKCTREMKKDNETQNQKSENKFFEQ